MARWSSLEKYRAARARSRRREPIVRAAGAPHARALGRISRQDGHDVRYRGPHVELAFKLGLIVVAVDESHDRPLTDPCTPGLDCHRRGWS
jgi:hypothetical protein